ncbi:MAG: cob(I)yrinic acid a,c-diamide adenosyltransferase [Haloarculaceae archaeon]
MDIYTGRGDEGETDLRDMTRVPKTSPRIEAYGTVDEVNALVGVAVPTGYDDVDETLHTVQNHLHVLQSELSNPDPDPGDDDPAIARRHVAAVEAAIDDADDELDPLEQFVLPGGSESGAKLHHARAVCRRAERRVLLLAEQEDVREPALVYLNRLSDLLFTLARLVNGREGVPEDNPDYA